MQVQLAKLLPNDRPSQCYSIARFYRWSYCYRFHGYSLCKRMSVRTYNPSVRVGNWNEDICLEEDLLKDFLEKKENGDLLVQKAHNLLQTILRPVKLPSLSDGFLHIGDQVVLLHTPSRSVVSAYMSAAAAHEATRLASGSLISCSKSVQPCPRNIFVIGSADKCDDGEVVKFGQHITLSTLPEEGGHLHLHSDSFSFMKHSKHSREQEVTLTSDVNYQCSWKFLHHDQCQRLESEGEPVTANSRVFINHCKTNQHLAVHQEKCLRTPFGREYEVTACTKLNQYKTEDTHNHFMAVSGCVKEVLED